MRTRAERRANNERVKKNFYKSLLNWPWTAEYVDILEQAEQRSKFYNTRKQCSCLMCGNPRKHWNSKTIQEISAVSSNSRIIGS